MKIKKKKGDLLLIPEVNLVAGNFEELREKFLTAIKKDTGKNVILDASGIEVVDSLGVNLIIGMFKDLNSTSRTFKIINAGDKFIKVAQFFKFPSLFTIEGTEDSE